MNVNISLQNKATMIRATLQTVLFFISAINVVHKLRNKMTRSYTRWQSKHCIHRKLSLLAQLSLLRKTSAYTIAVNFSRLRKLAQEKSLTSGRQITRPRKIVADNSVIEARIVVDLVRRSRSCHSHIHRQLLHISGH